jgi:hypothetical protein
VIIAPTHASPRTLSRQSHFLQRDSNERVWRAELQMEDPDDIALRAHIQDQLLDYVNEHINIDHVAYTEYVATKVCCPETDSELLPRHHSPILGSKLLLVLVRESPTSLTI